MKIIKYLLFIIGLYFIFSIIVFIAVNSPKEGSWYKVYSNNKKVVVRLNNFTPTLSYQVLLYLKKDNNNPFNIFNEQGKKILEINRQVSPYEPVKIADVTMINKTKYFFSESPLSINEKFDKNKVTMIRTLVALPRKNLHSFIIVNKILIFSFINYLTKDIGFKIIYLVIIFIILFFILKIRKDLKL